AASLDRDQRGPGRLDRRPAREGSQRRRGLQRVDGQVREPGRRGRHRPGQGRAHGAPERLVDRVAAADDRSARLGDSGREEGSFGRGRRRRHGRNVLKDGKRKTEGPAGRTSRPAFFCAAKLAPPIVDSSPGGARMIKRVVPAMIVWMAAAPVAAQSGATGGPRTLKWSIEVHGGANAPTNPSGGTSALPPPGVTFSTLVGRDSRRVPSWYFGDGASLLNQ